MDYLVRFREALREFSERHRRELLTFVICLAVSALTPVILQGVASLGWRIPQAHMSTDYITGVWVAAFLTLLLLPLPIEKAEKKALLTLWFAKCFVTLVLMLFYEWNYPLDAYWYFEVSQTRLVDLPALRFGDGTTNLNVILWHFENEFAHTHSYHALKVILSFVGLGAIFLLYRGLRCASD